MTVTIQHQRNHIVIENRIAVDRSYAVHASTHNNRRTVELRAGLGDCASRSLLYMYVFEPHLVSSRSQTERQSVGEHHRYQ